MKLVCESCGHKETVNKEFFMKALGGAVAGFGFWAWVSFLFAGTGFAMGICVAIVLGGVGIAAYSNEITEWASKKYECPKCGQRNWICVKTKKEEKLPQTEESLALGVQQKEIERQQDEIERLKKENELLKELAELKAENERLKKQAAK